MPRGKRRAPAEPAAKSGLASYFPAFQCFAGLKKPLASRSEEPRDFRDIHEESPPREIEHPEDDSKQLGAEKAPTSSCGMDAAQSPEQIEQTLQGEEAKFQEEPVSILNLDTLQHHALSSEDECSDVEALKVETEVPSTCGSLASQHRAVAVLAQAMESSNVHKIEEACDDAENHGVDDLMVENGRRLAWQLRMAGGLQFALQSGNAHRIEAACKNAESAGVDCEVVENARKELIEYRHHALTVAMSSSDSDYLEEACNNAQRAGVDAGVLEAGWQRLKEMRGIADSELDAGLVSKSQSRESEPQEWYIGTPAPDAAAAGPKIDCCSGGRLLDVTGADSADSAMQFPRTDGPMRLADDPAFNSKTGTWREDPSYARAPVAAIAERNRHAAHVLLDVTDGDGSPAPHPEAPGEALVQLLEEAAECGKVQSSLEMVDDEMEGNIADNSPVFGALYWKGGMVIDEDAFSASPRACRELVSDCRMSDELVKDASPRDSDDDAFPAVAEGSSRACRGLVSDCRMSDDAFPAAAEGTSPRACRGLVSDCRMSDELLNDEPPRDGHQLGGEPIHAVDADSSAFYWKVGIADFSDSESEVEAEAVDDCRLALDAVMHVSVEALTAVSRSKHDEDDASDDCSFTRALSIDASTTANQKGDDDSADDFRHSPDAAMDVSVDASTTANHRVDDETSDDFGSDPGTAMSASVDASTTAYQRGDCETLETVGFTPDEAEDAAVDASTAANARGYCETSDSCGVILDPAMDALLFPSTEADRNGDDDEALDDCECTPDVAMDAPIHASAAADGNGDDDSESDDCGCTPDVAMDAPLHTSAAADGNGDDDGESDDCGCTPDAAMDAPVDASAAANQTTGDETSDYPGLSLDATDDTLPSSDQEEDESEGRAGPANDIDWEDPFALLSGMAEQQAEAEPEAEVAPAAEVPKLGYSRGFGALFRLFGGKGNQQFTDSEAPTRSSSCEAVTALADFRML